VINIRMKTIGVVGGVASGKSLVSKMLVELGAAVLDADRTGHDVLTEDAQVREAIRQRWGDSALGPNGRRIIAGYVFGDDSSAATERQFLEDLLHPRIRERLNKLRDEYFAEGKPAVVLDAPLLLEAGWAPICDLILFVDVPDEVRRERGRSRGWTDVDFARREASQWPISKKRCHATNVIPNAGSEDELRTAVRKFWAENIAEGSANE
jgi:dephospho-CoA kinase